MSGQRGERRARRWLPFALGALAVLTVIAVDPAAATLLLYVDFLVTLGTVGLALAHGDLRTLVMRVLTSHAVVLCRAGAGLTRAEPRSLLR